MNHRSIPPRLGHPATSLSTEVVTSEPSRPHASALPRFRFALYAVRSHGFRSGAPLGAPRRHSRRFASGYSLSLHRSAFVWLRFRSDHLVCGGFCHGSYSFSTAHPHIV